MGVGAEEVVGGGIEIRKENEIRIGNRKGSEHEGAMRTTMRVHPQVVNT